MPFGWTQHRTADGKVYYQDHNTKTTHWSLPKSMAHSRSVSSITVIQKPQNPVQPPKPIKNAAYWHRLTYQCAMFSHDTLILFSSALKSINVFLFHFYYE